MLVHQLTSWHQGMGIKHALWRRKLSPTIHSNNHDLNVAPNRWDLSAYMTATHKVQRYKGLREGIPSLIRESYRVIGRRNTDAGLGDGDITQAHPE